MNFHFVNNAIFLKTLRSSAALVSNRTRIFLLLSQAVRKVNKIEDKSKIAQEAKFKLSVLGRMLKAFVSREYTSVPWKAIVGIAATLIYFVNPADLIPDFIPLTGLADDFGVLLWMFNSIHHEIESFLAWENTRMKTS